MSTSSISAMPIVLWAMKYAPVGNLVDRMVLMIYADHADPDGCNTYPSNRTIGEIAMCDPKTVKASRARLVAQGLLRYQGGARPPRYRKIDPHYRPELMEAMLPHSHLGAPQIEDLNELRAERTEYGDTVNSRPLAPQNRPEPLPPERKGRKTRSDKGKPNPARSPKQSAQTTPPPPDIALDQAKQDDDPGVAEDSHALDPQGGGISFPRGGESHSPGEGGNLIPGGGGISFPQPSPRNPPQLLKNLTHSCSPSDEPPEDPVSDDGQAVADALSHRGWDTDDVTAALPAGVKVSGPGVERIASRCTELSGWGLSDDEISQLLASAPKNNPDKSLLRRTATPEDARKTLAGSDEDGREDVDRVCDYLADTVAQLGFTRPSAATVRSKPWRSAARLMIDSDHAPSEDESGNPISKKITEDAIIRMIDWVAQDEFWGGKGNIRSMPKLRKQFETLAAQSREKHKKRTGNGSSGGFRSRWEQQEEFARYWTALEMSMDYVLDKDDPSYRQDLGDAKIRGGHAGMMEFREKVFGPRSGWSTKVTRERLETLFGRIRQAGYRMRENELTQNRKDSWAQALAESGESLPEQEPGLQEEPDGPGAGAQAGSAQQADFDPEDPEQQPRESRDDWAVRFMNLQRRQYALPPV